MEQQTLLLDDFAGPDENARGVQKSSPLVYFFALIVAMGSVAFGYQLGLSSPISILDPLPEEFEGRFDVFSSLISIGAIFGGFAGGSLADKFGRKKTILFNAIPYSAAMVGMYFSKNLIELLICRLVSGFSVGVISLTVPMYIAEVSTADLRGTLGGLAQLGVVSGILMAYVAGFPIKENRDWWRDMCLIGVGPIAVQFLGVLFIPESPSWLISKGRTAEVEKALKICRAECHNIKAEIAEIRSRMNTEEGSFSDLFSKKMQKPLLVGVGMQVLQQFTGINAVIFFSGGIFALAGVDATVSTIVVGGVQFVVTFIACALLDRLGRRPLLLTAAIGMCLAELLLAFCFVFKDTLPKMISLAAVCAYIAFFSLAMGPVPWLIMAEVFPANVRGKAMSLATVVNWLGAFIIVQATTPLLKATPSGAFFIFCGMCALSVIFIFTQVPETKGKSLEQIEAEFNGKAKK